MKKNKIVVLKEYKSKKQIKKQMEELEYIAREQCQYMTRTEQKGYDNFMKLIKTLDVKYTVPTPE
jgi:hypothetical protein